MSEHSPTPWTAGNNGWIRDLRGNVIATARKPQDARFITQASNLHDALADVLSTAALLLGCGDPLGDFEDLADLFYQETGYMRFGKSDVREMHSDEERQERFKEWVALKKRDIAAVLAAVKEDAK